MYGIGEEMRRWLVEESYIGWGLWKVEDAALLELKGMAVTEAENEPGRQ